MVYTHRPQASANRTDKPHRTPLHAVRGAFVGCGGARRGMRRAERGYRHVGGRSSRSMPARRADKIPYSLLAEKLDGEILAPVPHRHVVFTIPYPFKERG